MEKPIVRLTTTAMFIALILLLGMTPLGLIPLGFVNVTILGLPVIVGTLLLQLKSGLILGACFGLVSALSAFGMTMTPPSALAAALVAQSPGLAIVMCLVPRLMIPVVTHGMHELMSRRDKTRAYALPVCAIAGSLTNTVLYLGMMFVFYLVAGLDVGPVVKLIGGIAIFAGGSEAVVNALLATPIVLVLRRIQKKQS